LSSGLTAAKPHEVLQLTENVAVCCLEEN